MLPRQFAKLKVHKRSEKVRQLIGSSVSIKATLTWMTVLVLDDQQNWITMTCKQSWTWSLRQALAIWHLSLELASQPYIGIWSSSTLCTRNRVKIHTNSPKHRPIKESKFTDNCYRIHEMTAFGNELWRRTRSGSTWSTTTETSDGFHRVKQRHQFQNKIDLAWKSCCASGGTLRESCTLSWFRTARPSMHSSFDNSWTVSMRSSRRNTLP